MDIIITAVGEFVWTASCAVVNFCVSSGVSVLAVFVSFLCAILASAFYKYTTSNEQMSLNDARCPFLFPNNDDLNNPTTITSTTESSEVSLLPVATDDEPNNNNKIIESLTEIEICITENPDENGHENKNENENANKSENENENEYEENHEQISDDILIETIEGTEEEIQKQQIANIYRLLNDQHLINNWTTTDFLDQLKMYGLHDYDEGELETS